MKFVVPRREWPTSYAASLVALLVLAVLQPAAALSSAEDLERKSMAQAVEDMHKRFKAASGDAVLDTQAGVEWTRSDNGGDVNWSQASSHCRSLGKGWSLPTVAQLQSLYKSGLPSVPCGKSSCEVPDQFRLSGFWFWSVERDGPARAWVVDLNLGIRYSCDVGCDLYVRALCIRHP
jgi:hypothetical protein